ncbi:MAG: molybdenum cofactor biosynthesis protein MoaE [Nitrososphaerota archaeon]
MESRRTRYKTGVYGKEDIDLVSLLQDFIDKKFNGEVGALAIFIGKVKGFSVEGIDVSHLEIETYKEHADKTLEKICEEVRERHRLAYAGIWHLIGRFNIGEPIVIVVAAGKSRKEVFKALPELVERYKKEPALFKKEVYIDGSYRWLEE